MLATEFIKIIEQSIEQHKPMEEILGPLNIVIDLFQIDEDTKSYYYVGFSKQIKMDLDIGNGDLILSANAADYGS